MLFLHASVLFVLFGLIYYYFTRTFTYWQWRKVPGPKPLPFFGNIKGYILRKSTAAILHQRIYNEYPNEKVVGIYRMTSPSMIIRDLDVVKNVLIKDFNHFEDRGIEFSKKGLGANLFHADSEIWRPLRILFSPLFTTVKLKNMIPLIVARSDVFIDHFKIITDKQTEQDIYPLIQQFTMSSILACAFGLDVSVISDQLLEKMKKIDQMTFSRNVVHDLDILFPGVLKRLNSSLFPKELSNFFLDMVADIMEARNGIPSNRKDFIDLVLEAKNQGNILETKKDDNMDSTTSCVKLTNEVIAAQAFIFYIAGYETNATTMSFMMYELANNPRIQDKLIEEVDEVLLRHDGKITYEMISELPYMEKVINETLRKYPVADIQRCAKANYNIPGTNITIEKGTTIFVPTLAISYDEKYYPNPKKFDPERFSPENESQRHSCAFIPFGAGPRYCIGMLFARIQSRVFLLKFLTNFRVEPSKNTQTTITFDPERLVSAPKGGIYLNLIPRNQNKTKNK